MGTKTKTDTKRHRKTKAALAAGAVAGTVAATAAYRRHQARLSPTLHPPTPDRGTHPTDLGSSGADSNDPNSNDLTATQPL